MKDENDLQFFDQEGRNTRKSKLPDALITIDALSPSLLFLGGKGEVWLPHNQSHLFIPE